MKRQPNHLINEESPYLRQHAYNPVEWYPWSEEALDKAKSEDKPILVSIGYATCHWCHVMERESFEDERIAAVMNEHFVNIKVDREERPDIDHFFMEALQYLGTPGGWPLNVFLTPDQKPFTGGTYYPPQPKYNRPSWYQVLNRMSKAFRERRSEIEEQADRLSKLIKGEATSIKDKYPSLDWQGGEDAKSPWQDLYRKIRESFDVQNGGFGGAPKFPQVSTLLWLNAFGLLEDDQEALWHVRYSLAKMIAGGIYDIVGGGFARYAVDKAWKIPHFEKMLYDNALLLDVMSQVQSMDPHPYFADAMRQSGEFLLREMKQPDGGFASAIDADSDGLEGKFYVWSWRQLQEIFDDQELNELADTLDLSLEGNWEYTNILYLKNEEAGDLGQLLDRWYEKKESIKPLLQMLFTEREKRNRPITDQKVLTSWNAMTVTAFVSMYISLEDAMWKEEAFELMHYLHKHHRDKNGDLLRLPAKSKKKVQSFLDDKAWFVKAALRCAYIDPEGPWREIAFQEIEKTIRDFYDPAEKLFYENRSDKAGDMPRMHQLYDAGLPSGNSVMVLNLLEAAILFDRQDWSEMATSMIESMSGVIAQFPSSLSYWAMGWMALDKGFDEWAVMGPEYREKIISILKKFRPFRVVDGSVVENASRPLINGKEVAEETLIYLCANYACRRPVKEVEEIDDF